MIIGIAVSETSSLPIIFLRIALNISVLMRPPFVGITGVKKDSSGSDLIMNSMSWGEYPAAYSMPTTAPMELATMKSG